MKQYGLEIAGVVLFILTAVLVRIVFKMQKNKSAEIEAAKAATLLQEKEKRIEELSAENTALRKEKEDLSAQNVKMLSDIENQKKYLEERVADLRKSKEEMALRFQSVSSEILKAQTSSFTEEQKKSLDAVLTPFKEQMADFKAKVEKAHEESIKNKSSFDTQLRNLMDLNKNLSKDAQGLTDALRGNKKLQGNWGEFQLERVLEISGLQKDINYTTQENFKDGEDKNRRPDVIIYMPDSRNIIVDSKVSLNDYMDYANCDGSLEEKEHLLSRHVDCIKRHINGLSSKEYQKLLKERSLDYVIIFIPIESAYIDAVKYDSSLYDFAYRHGVVIATPSSLLPILRTVENLWRLEKQNRNVQEIAAVGGLLFDKIANFSEDLKKIGSSLEASRKSYDAAVTKLTEGRGNALTLANRLKELGAKTVKEIPADFIKDN
ncbi:rmuC domain protein [Acetobacter sp. CAG:977]|nr:rmuC domain protein [Acetobacter sp. CAG:977]